MLLAGVQAENFDQPLQSLDSLDLETVAETLTFLKEFREGVYEECRAYKHQKPDEWWVNLVTIFNNRNLPEQQILNRHYKELRRAWKKRYKATNGTTNAKPKSDPVKD